MGLIKTETDFLEHIENLKLNKRDFNIIHSSGKSQVVQGGGKNSFYPNTLKKNKDMYFLKQVKDYIFKNEIKYLFKKEIEYQKQYLKLNLNELHEGDIYEIDLKGAYWFFAKQNNFISKKLYTKGLSIDKLIRLIALGQLAKREYVFKFKKGVQVGDMVEVKNKLTEGVFFKCSYDCDLLMNVLCDALRADDVYFYWVDAIFFKGKKNIEIITDLLIKVGINFKIVKIKSIQMLSNCIEVKNFNQKNNLETRPFMFRKENNLNKNKIH